MKLTKKDNELIKFATKVVKENFDLYKETEMHVACAIRAKSGKIYKGMCVKSSHAVCAEQVAIGNAFACGEREFDTIVAVKMDKDGSTKVVSPCGLCRYIFDKLELDIWFIVVDIKNNKLLKVKTTDLLPYPYKR